MSAQEVFCRSCPILGSPSTNAKLPEASGGSEWAPREVQGQKTPPATEQPLRTVWQGPNASAPGRGPRSATAT